MVSAAVGQPGVKADTQLSAAGALLLLAVVWPPHQRPPRGGGQGARQHSMQKPNHHKTALQTFPLTCEEWQPDARQGEGRRAQVWYEGVDVPPVTLVQLPLLRQRLFLWEGEREGLADTIGIMSLQHSANDGTSA